MKRGRVDRRTFVKAMAGSTTLPALAAGATERAVAAARRSGVEQSGKPRLRFAVIGINHNHINSQVGAVLRGGGELVWLYAKRTGSGEGFPEAVSAGEARAQRGRGSPGFEYSTRLELGDPVRAGADRHSRDAARQGLHVRQAGHHDARAAGRGEASAGADSPHLLDHGQ